MTDRVLVVDDDPMVRALVTAELIASGFAVQRAADGSSARTLLLAGPIDLVLLDVLLPDGSGLELLEWLRAEGRLATIPVIVLTGLDQEALIDAAFEAGATDFLRKPVEPAILAHRVRFALRESRTRQRLAASEASLAEAQRIARVGSFEIEVAVGRLLGSQQLQRMLRELGAGDEPSIDRLLDEVHPEDRGGVIRAFEAVVDDPGAGELELGFRMGRGGRMGWYEARILLDRDAAGELVRLHGTLQDVSEKQRHREAIEYLVTHDELTGLFNREGFERVVEGLLELARHRGSQAALLHVGIDRVGRVQGQLGPDGGEALLYAIADRLRSVTRDREGPGRSGPGLVWARLGGNELVAFADDLRAAGEADELAVAVLGRLAEPLRIDGHELGVVGRVGVARFPDDGRSLEQLVRNAHAALRSPEFGQRDLVRHYRPRFTADADLRLELERDLRAALGEQQLALHYQPQVDASGRVVAAEALLRWQHPQHGWIPPSRFVPLAEETGLIDAIGAWVLDRACADLARWRRQGAQLRVAVNLSAAQFDDPHLPDSVLAALERHDLPGEALELEVTESLLLGGGPEVDAALAGLEAAGVSLSLDDFGTGYSSLSYLSELSLDRLKIDRSFVAGLSRPRPRTVVRAIIALARDLGLGIVAEGVETEAQARALLDEGCDLLQGYHLGRPAPAASLDRLLLPSGTR